MNLLSAPAGTFMFYPRILGFVAKVLGPSDSECDLYYGFLWFSGLRFGGLHHWLSQGTDMLTGNPGTSWPS